jgi:hypothetical protein
MGVNYEGYSMWEVMPFIVLKVYCRKEIRLVDP